MHKYKKEKLKSGGYGNEITRKSRMNSGKEVKNIPNCVSFWAWAYAWNKLKRYEESCVAGGTSQRERILAENKKPWLSKPHNAKLLQAYYLLFLTFVQISEEKTRNNQSRIRVLRIRLTGKVHLAHYGWFMQVHTTILNYDSEMPKTLDLTL